MRWRHRERRIRACSRSWPRAAGHSTPASATLPSSPGAESRSSRTPPALESKGTPDADASDAEGLSLKLHAGNEMTMTTTTDVMAIEKDHLLQVYRRNQVVFDHGRGCRLFDTNGRSYLDLISGVGVAALGHAHPRLAAAVSAQAQELLHTSNLFFHPLQGELAERLG